MDGGDRHRRHTLVRVSNGGNPNKSVQKKKKKKKKKKDAPLHRLQWRKTTAEVVQTEMIPDGSKKTTADAVSDEEGTTASERFQKKRVEG